MRKWFRLFWIRQVWARRLVWEIRLAKSDAPYYVRKRNRIADYWRARRRDKIKQATETSLRKERMELNELDRLRAIKEAQKKPGADTKRIA